MEHQHVYAKGNYLFLLIINNRGRISDCTICDYSNFWIENHKFCH